MEEITIQNLLSIEIELEETERDLIEVKGEFDALRYQTLSSKHHRLKAITDKFREWQKYRELFSENQSLENETTDPELKALIVDDNEQLSKTIEELGLELELSLLPPDKDADLSCYLEIRAGTGGEEASLFCADLSRMYINYAAAMSWKTEIEDSVESESGGLREVYIKVVGKGAYGYLRHENGGHRVQRVPATESQGRIHTSACTVMVLPDNQKSEGMVEIKSSDLRIDTFRASGAGGQHVNKTDSAVRITHLPTGIVATCQNGRSQHQNKDSAMAQLRARITSRLREEEKAQELKMRSSLLSDGGRSDRIRTYNFPQNRVTDHRINYTIHHLEGVLGGNIQDLVDRLNKTYKLELLQKAREKE